MFPGMWPLSELRSKVILLYREIPRAIAMVAFENGASVQSAYHSEGFAKNATFVSEAVDEIARTSLQYICRSPSTERRRSLLHALDLDQFVSAMHP